MSDVKSIALSRIESILDENSFVETLSLAKQRSTDFTDGKAQAPSDGVITGHGIIDGDPVFIFAEDPEVLGGTVGEIHAKKIIALYDLAMKTGSPVIGLLDSKGIRLSESVDALEAVGSILKKASDAKGIVPEVMAVYGECGGGLSVLTAMSDFCFMTKDSKLFLNSPDAIPGNNKEKLDTSSSDFQFENSGKIDFTGSEAEVASKIRELIATIPLSDRDGGRFEECTDDLNRASVGIAEMRSDIKAYVSEISDDNFFFETKPGFAKEMVTGFIKLDGETIGVIGNQAKDGKFVLTRDGSEKASDFLGFCDDFSIPVLSLVNAEGYEISEASERRLPDALAGLVYSFAEASVPMVTVYLNKAYGTSYLLMNAKSVGADMVYAYEDTEMGSMDAHNAAAIIKGDSDKDLSEIEKEFAEKALGAENAAAHGYIDRILTFADTRKYLIDAFEILATKEVY